MELGQSIIEFIVEEGRVMMYALYVLGVIIKHTEKIVDNFIPLILLGVSLLLTPLLLGGYNAANIVQAMLIAGAPVLINQIVKQGQKYKKGE